MDFMNLLQNGFSTTGIFPFSYERILSLTPLPSSSAPLNISDNEADWLSVRNSLRNLGFAHSVIEETLRNLILTSRGQSTTAVFAQELAKIVRQKEAMKCDDLAINRRINPN